MVVGPQGPHATAGSAFRRGRRRWWVGGIVLVAVALGWAMRPRPSDPVSAVFVEPADRRPPESRQTASEPTDATTSTRGAALLQRLSASRKSAATPAATPTALERLLIPHGGGDGALGVSHPDEGNPQAPMALASAGPAGPLWVVDTVNGRLARWDAAGRSLAPLPLPVTSGADLAVGSDGTLAVLDRLVDREVALLDSQGRSIGALPLAGPGLGSTGSVTAVTVDGNDVWVESDHGAWVRVGDTEGHPAAAEARETLPGRPLTDGVATAWMLGDPPAEAIAVSLAERASPHAARWTTRLASPVPVWRIEWLADDGAGTVFVGAVAGRDGEMTARLWCLRADRGTLRGLGSVPVVDGPEEMLHPWVIGPDGAVYRLDPGPDGTRLRRVTCADNG